MSLFSRKKHIPQALNEAQREHSRLCYQLGELEYKRRINEEESKKIVNQLRELNKKGAKLQQKMENIRAFEKPATESGEEDGQAD